jgi:hypothetical protein
MGKRSTIIFKFNKKWGANETGILRIILRQGLSEQFSPSEITVNQILAFAHAYRTKIRFVRFH